MAGAAVGPIYGPIPELNPVWAIANPETGAPLYTPEDARELIRDAMAISGGYRELHKLSQAMNSLAQISALAVAKVQDQLLHRMALEAKISQLRSADPTDVGLPLVRADVVEYSEEPLRRGLSLTQIKTQPLQEESGRLAVKICRALNLQVWALPEAPCCDGFAGGGTARIRRS